MKLVVFKKEESYLDAMEKLKNSLEDCINNLTIHLIYANPVTRDKMVDSALDAISTCLSLVDKGVEEGSNLHKRSIGHIEKNSGDRVAYISVFEGELL